MAADFPLLTDFGAAAGGCEADFVGVCVCRWDKGCGLDVAAWCNVAARLGFGGGGEATTDALASVGRADDLLVLALALLLLLGPLLLRLRLLLLLETTGFLLFMHRRKLGMNHAGRQGRHTWLLVRV